MSRAPAPGTSKSFSGPFTLPALVRQPIVIAALLAGAGFSLLSNTRASAPVVEPREAQASLEKITAQMPVLAFTVPPELKSDPNLQTAVAERKDLVPVISSEIMSGQPYIGGRDGALIADRLKETFPEASVMISIREQLGLLPSLYMQYLQAGGTMPCAKFFAGRTVIGNYGFDPDFYEFDKFVGHYVRLFGQEHVMVHPMELLIRDPKAIVRGLRALTGAQTDADKVDYSNATYGAKEFVVPVIRRINHFRKNDFDHEPMIDFGPLGWIAYRAVNKFSRSTLGNRIGRESKPVSRYVKERFTGRYA